MNLSFKNYLSAACLTLAIFGLNACVKDRNPGATDFSNLAPTVSIVEGGLAKFSSQSLVFPGTDDSDTYAFRVNYAATTVAPRDITITLAYDAAALTAYNADPANQFYNKFPDSIYQQLQTKVIIKKGQSYSNAINLVIFPSKIDPSKNYMLPVSIVDAEGIVIASNFRTIYFHLIGNPLAGPYKTVGKRYNYTGQVSWAGPSDPYPTPFADGTTAAYNSIVIAAPVNSLTVKLINGNVPDPAGGSAFYYITANDATFSSISYDQGPTFEAGYSNIKRYILNYSFIGAGIAASPKPTFHLITKYTNGGGNDRIVDQTFTHQ